MPKDVARPATTGSAQVLRLRRWPQSVQVRLREGMVGTTRISLYPLAAPLSKLTEPLFWRFRQCRGKEVLPFFRPDVLATYPWRAASVRQ